MFYCQLSEVADYFFYADVSKQGEHDNDQLVIVKSSGNIAMKNTGYSSGHATPGTFQAGDTFNQARRESRIKKRSWDYKQNAYQHQI